MHKSFVKTSVSRMSPGLVKLNRQGVSLAVKQFLWVWFTLILSLYISWMTLANVNFGYGIWHDYAGIGENIEQYAPQNKFRHHFETTDADTHKRLFSEIVTAIHHQGQGLRALSYRHPTKPIALPLLHTAEIVHLTDVANLIEFLKKIGWGILLVWAALTAFLMMGRQPFPTPQKSLLNVGLGVLILAVPITIVGIKKVFYQLHIWIFPEDHQWFFYYQDSLMSTMMKAPDLFAYIGLSLGGVALLIFVILLKLFNRKIATHSI